MIIENPITEVAASESAGGTPLLPPPLEIPTEYNLLDHRRRDTIISGVRRSIIGLEHKPLEYTHTQLHNYCRILDELAALGDLQGIKECEAILCRMIEKLTQTT